jgi:hypothetical protein
MKTDDGFDLSRDANERGVLEERGPNDASSRSVHRVGSAVDVTWTEVPRLGAAARHEKGDGRNGDVCLDGEPHSSRRKRASPSSNEASPPCSVSLSLE